MPLQSEDTQELAQRWPLLTQLDLPSDSIVLVVGAYKGLAMKAIHELYEPEQLHGYEPQLWAAEEAVERFQRDLNCRVHAYGLGITNGEFEMGEYHTDACSFINTGLHSRLHGKGELRDADIVLGATVGAGKIDLMVMNIEGYEYELLPYLIEKGWLAQIDRLAVQFHLNMGNDGNLDEILSQIDETHDRVLDEFPAWIYWRRK